MFESVYIGSEFFLAKYLVYFLRLITPFVSRSVAALLNISRETGSVVSPSEVYFDLWALLVGPPISLPDGCAVDVDDDEGVACSLGFDIGGVRKVTLSAAASCEAAVGMVCDLVIEDASSDYMGNNESKDGVLPAKEGTSLTKFPIVEEERVVFHTIWVLSLGQLHICPQPPIDSK